VLLPWSWKRGEEEEEREREKDQRMKSVFLFKDNGLMKLRRSQKDLGEKSFPAAFFSVPPPSFPFNERIRVHHAR
jgi:hypothetical protein